MYLTSPKTHRKLFFDNSISSYEERLAKVQEKALEDPEILEYCEQNNRIKNTRQESSYRRSENILERLATYLLMGMYKGNNILTLYKIRQQYDKEIVASNSGSNAENLIYGVDTGEEVNMTATTEMTNVEKEKSFELQSVSDIEKAEKKRNKQIARYKGSKSYKMEKLFCTPEIPTYRVYVKRDEETGKPLKNVFGQPIHDFDYVTIGGNKGVVDKNRPHMVKWCTVDTDNQFEFNGHTFKISDKLKQYKVDEDNQCEMDKILCYFFKDEIEYLFFDMNIEDVDDYVVQTH